MEQFTHLDNEVSRAHNLIFRMGQLLLKNGAEIGRVQQTMELVAKAVGIVDYDVYVLTNAIFASGEKDGKSVSAKLKYVPSFSIHFGRISEVNQLSRDLTNGLITVTEAEKRIIEIENIKDTSPLLQVFACALGSACFCYLFSGEILDCINAFFCGALVQLFLLISQKYFLSKFITNIIASGIAAFFAFIFFSFGLGRQLDIIIIGSIIRLVPGIALTTAIRDFINGDHLSGTIRLTDAIIVGVCIAVGVGAVMATFS